MKENKGFSLVELIVVVAIMAVLVGILAPAYLSYVEKTRIGADEDAAEEIRRAVETATAEVAVYDEVIGSLSGGSVSHTFGATVSSCSTLGAELKKSLQDVFGDTKGFSPKSKKYAGKSAVVTITNNSNLGTGAALDVSVAIQ